PLSRLGPGPDRSRPDCTRFGDRLTRDQGCRERPVPRPAGFPVPPLAEAKPIPPAAPRRSAMQRTLFRRFALWAFAAVYLGAMTSAATAGSFTRGCAADRKSTRLNSSHVSISYAVFCLKKKID